MKKNAIKIYYAGAPEHGVGDIIIKNALDTKIKLPVQLANEFGVKTQIAELCMSKDSYKNKDDDLLILNLDELQVYKRNSTLDKNFVLVVSDGVAVDSTIPTWIWASISTSKRI